MDTNVLAKLFSDISTAFNTAALALRPKEINLPEASSETAKHNLEETKAPVVDMGALSNKDAMGLVKNADTIEDLEALLEGEKSRKSKARKGLIKKIEEKLAALNSDVDAVEESNIDESNIEEMEDPSFDEPEIRDSFTKAHPAKTDGELALFKNQFKALGKDGQPKWIAGEIDSLGNAIGKKKVTEELDDLEEFSDDDLDDLEDVKTYTEDELRTAFKAYAKAEGKDAARAVIRTFGVSKVADLPANKYPDFMEEVSI